MSRIDSRPLLLAKPSTEASWSASGREKRMLKLCYMRCVCDCAAQFLLNANGREASPALGWNVINSPSATLALRTLRVPSPHLLNKSVDGNEWCKSFFFFSSGSASCPKGHFDGKGSARNFIKTFFYLRRFIGRTRTSINFLAQFSFLSFLRNWIETNTMEGKVFGNGNINKTINYAAEKGKTYAPSLITFAFIVRHLN